MTLKYRNSQHIIEFENENTRQNIGNFELSKFVSLNNMNDSQKNEVKQSLFGIQKTISKNAYPSLSTYNSSLIDFNNILGSKKELDFNIPVTDISDDANRIYGTYLNVSYGLNDWNKLLVKRKNKAFDRLT
jgi:hypothetical protein